MTMRQRLAWSFRSDQLDARGLFVRALVVAGRNQLKGDALIGLQDVERPHQVRAVHEDFRPAVIRRDEPIPLRVREELTFPVTRTLTLLGFPLEMKAAGDPEGAGRSAPAEKPGGIVLEDIL
jgi:hypothetical protein